jgi:4-hydroxybenzoate polyprenyltransferase
VSRARPYVQLARPDHWFKHVFMIPGALLVLHARPELVQPALAHRLVLALVAACLIASSYYVLNEILDASFDANHPVKRARPAPSGQISIPLAYAEWAALALVGLAVARELGMAFFAAAAALWLNSLIYNVWPLRTKDRPHLDILTESLNKPLRLALGWYATGTDLVIPVSIVMAFWMLGAFFMAVKRFAEYRLIGDPAKAAAYRASFSTYTAETLLVSATFYAVAFGLFLGIFLIRYRVELLVTIPLIAGLMAWYIHLGFKPDSPAQYPERLHGEHGFMAYLALCVLGFTLALLVDMPWLYDLFQPTGELLGEGRP